MNLTGGNHKSDNLGQSKPGHEPLAQHKAEYVRTAPHQSISSFMGPQKDRGDTDYESIPSVTQTSLDAYDWINKKGIKGRLYQEILGVLSDGRPRTREELIRITRQKTQTLTARCCELKKNNILVVCGYGRTTSGCKAELLTIP